MGHHWAPHTFIDDYRRPVQNWVEEMRERDRDHRWMVGREPITNSVQDLSLSTFVDDVAKNYTIWVLVAGLRGAWSLRQRRTRQVMSWKGG